MPPELLVEVRPPFRSPGARTRTSSSGRSTGSELSTIWCSREKIAVLAPIPRARDKTTTRLRRGALDRLRTANLMRDVMTVIRRRPATVTRNFHFFRGSAVLYTLLIHDQAQFTAAVRAARRGSVGDARPDALARHGGGAQGRTEVLYP